MENCENQTPMMRQYMDIKSEHKDTILLFRLGDFYEMFFEDACEASKILEITLTSRNKNSNKPVPLCGIPFHSADGYIAKLIKAGKRVAICEQTEDPKLAKKRGAKAIVKREVVQIITPGINLDEKILEADSNNFLLSYSIKDESPNSEISICFIDVSTEEFKYTFKESTESAIDEIFTIAPKEIVISDSVRKTSFTQKLQQKLAFTLFSFVSDDNINSDEDFDKTNKNIESENAKHSILTILSYLKRTKLYSQKLLESLSFYESSSFMSLDPRTRSNLEIIESTVNKEATLFKTLNYTKTSMAKRMLKNWLLYPLLSKTEIDNRLDSVDFLINEKFFKLDLIEIFSSLNDLERLTGKASQNCLTPRDAASLKTSLMNAEKIFSIPLPFSPPPRLLLANLTIVKEKLKTLKGLIKLLSDGLNDNPPFSLKDGGTIKDGFSKDLDDLRQIKFNSKELIAGMEKKEREATGINNLKIKFNNVFGYFLEVSSGKLSLVPQHYIRKQTISNGERFITEELKLLENRILNAQEKIEALENELFTVIKLKIFENSNHILKLASAISTLDVLCSLAIAGEENDYVKPEISNGKVLDLIGARHPIVEKLSFEPFVPNDTLLNDSDQNQIILTGPNMSGKSTVMRQVALIVVMAQIGSFVPAKSAKIGIIDKLFTRIGASDNLSAGDSTFMVEMKETSYILENATNKSLIILDELGRGTSTFDGLSLAWAVSEFIYKKIKARTLFATHYHELTSLPKLFKGIKNYNIAVKQKDEEIFFLRKLVEGGVNRSYGIHVAKLANLPDEIIKAARKKLLELESTAGSNSQLTLFSEDMLSPAENEKDSFSKEVMDEISNFDTSQTTPLKALIFIDKLKTRIKRS